MSVLTRQRDAGQAAQTLPILAQLVGIDTSNPPGLEGAAAVYLAGLLGDFGFDVTLQPVDGARANVIAVLQNGSGPTIAFNTHMDVVPAGNGWTKAPFALTRGDDGRLYGRGACDAKGPLAAMAVAAGRLAADRASWSGTLVAVFVVDEEVGSAGARAFTAQSAPIDYAVIGEPTGNTVAIAHKGSLRPMVRITGVSAHSSRPQDGVNAIYGATALVARIEALAPIVARRTHPLCGAASLTVTRIAGGFSDNAVPDACDVLIDRRLVPGEDEAAVKADFERLLAELQRDTGVTATIARWVPTTGGATETRADAPIVAAARQMARQYGSSDALFGLGGACDLVHFNAMGTSGVVLGPGDARLAHVADEWIEADAVETAALLYGDLARSLMQN